MIEYQYLKVVYESLVSWQQDTDYLRCNPNFHGHSRYDFIIFRSANGPIFAKLLCLFSFTLGGSTYPLALVQAFDHNLQRRRTDKELGLTRIRARSRAATEIISIETIIRGALIAKDMEKHDEYLVMDLIDADMFMRIKELHK